MWGVSPLRIVLTKPNQIPTQNQKKVTMDVKIKVRDLVKCENLFTV